jgi:hypothetical protein
LIAAVACYLCLLHGPAFSLEIFPVLLLGACFFFTRMLLAASFTAGPKAAITIIIVTLVRDVVEAAT